LALGPSRPLSRGSFPLRVGTRQQADRRAACSNSVRLRQDRPTGGRTPNSLAGQWIFACANDEIDRDCRDAAWRSVSLGRSRRFCRRFCAETNPSSRWANSFSGRSFARIFANRHSFNRRVATCVAYSAGRGRQ
jgi:hypothetical protein